MSSCSFCLLRGHNISQCNSPFIPRFYENIKRDYIDIITNYNPSITKNLFYRI